MKRINLFPLINAVMFSVFIIVGWHLDKYKTILNIFETSNNILKISIVFLILTITFYFIIDKLYELLDRNVKKSKKKKSINKYIEFIFYHHPFRCMMATTLIVSIIYLIFYYPGVLTYDGKWQLNSFMRNWTYNDHHPAILSAFMGLLFNIGTYFVDNNFGIFLYIVPQMIINALVYGYVLKIMNKMDSPLALRIVSFIFFGFFPYLNINSITYIKDVMYYLIFLFLFLYQYNHFEIENDINIKIWIKLILLYLLLLLFRNTGYYTGLIVTISLAIVYAIKKKKLYVKTLVLCLISILLFNACYHKIILPTFNIKEGLIRERLSIPFQQTARYLTYYRDDVTEEEEKQILTLFTHDLDFIASEYNAYRSDHVKRQILDYPTTEELTSYFKAWYSMLKKHPLVYVDATLNNTYGYFFSEHRNFMGEDIGFYKTSKNEYTDVHFNSSTEKGRNILKEIADKICHTKIIGLLYSCYFYMWILIFISLYILHKKYYDLFVYFFPLYITVLFALISPVNGHLRYLYPVMVTLPAAVALLFYKRKNSKQSA